MFEMSAGLALVASAAVEDFVLLPKKRWGLSRVELRNLVSH
jgi:hypothetical protein